MENYGVGWMSSFPENQKGVALLTAMLVVTLGTVIAVNMMWNASLDLRRTTAALAADQGLLYLQGAEAWAGDILRTDLIASGESDNLGEQWAAALPPMPIDGGVIAGRLEDLHGRFNLNNLVYAGVVDEISQRQFERLLAVLGLDQGLAGIVVDWLDADVEVEFPNGGEDNIYTGRNPPYRTANTVITSPSELLAMSGVGKDAYRSLLPYVTALPSGSSINVNTASEYVMASLSDDIDLAYGAQLVQERGNLGFADINTRFQNLVEPDTLARISGISRYFLLTATVTLGTHQLTMYSLLERDSSGIVRAMFRSLGAQ
jgi:general secretion pathway protein K